MKHDPIKAAAERRGKVRLWIDVLKESAQDVEALTLSRTSETASEAGADPDPKLRPCEHRVEWRRGSLCLACDNTNLRRASAQERADGLAYDPMLLDPPRSTYTVVRDQSASGKKARDSEALDASIATLEHNERLRSGEEQREAREARFIRGLRGIERGLGRDGRKVLCALASLRVANRDYYVRAMRGDEAALAVVAALVPGRLRAPD